MGLAVAPSDREGEAPASSMPSGICTANPLISINYFLAIGTWNRKNSSFWTVQNDLAHACFI
jgi:hypothetical protein